VRNALVLGHLALLARTLKPRDDGLAALCFSGTIEARFAHERFDRGPPIVLSSRARSPPAVIPRRCGPAADAAIGFDVVSSSGLHTPRF
jgi:hypothetical protein